MDNLPKPYVGITGFTTEEHVAHGVDRFEAAGFTPANDRIGMMGFIVDHEMLNGGREHPHAPRYFRNVADIIPLALQSRDKALNVVHYTPPNRHFTAEDAKKIMSDVYHENACRTIQLNSDMPDPDQIEQMMSEFPELSIIFSIHPELISQGHHTIVEQLSKYRQGLKYALIDPSLGEAQQLQIDPAIDIAKAIEDADLGITIGFAGGHSGNNIYSRVRSIRKALGHKNFCIDAEGKLHGADDRLYLPEMTRYVQNSK